MVDIDEDGMDVFQQVCNTATLEFFTLLSLGFHLSIWGTQTKDIGNGKVVGVHNLTF